MVIVQTFLLKIELLTILDIVDLSTELRVKNPSFLVFCFPQWPQMRKDLDTEALKRTSSPPHSHFNTQYSLLDITFLVIKSRWACCKIKQQRLDNNV